MRRAALLVLLAVAALSVAIVVAYRSTRSTNAVPAGLDGSVTTTPAAVPAGANAFTGTVAETMNSGGYTYARLQDGKDDVWIAARDFSTRAGDRLTVSLEMPMENFESKTLKRTFPVVYFVSSVARDGQQVVGASGEGTAPSLMTSHAPGTVATRVEPVTPAPGGLAIADVWAKRTALAGQPITVRGTVVKVNDNILGRNWIHLQDGSGSAGDRTNDLTITTGEVLKVGDVITMTGLLAIDRDFGAGYAYGAIVENAKVVK